jgi:hypothetical protein
MAHAHFRSGIVNAKQAFQFIAETAQQRGGKAFNARWFPRTWECSGLCNAIDQLQERGRISASTAERMLGLLDDFPWRCSRSYGSRMYLFPPTEKGWEKRVILAMLLAEIA